MTCSVPNASTPKHPPSPSEKGFQVPVHYKNGSTNENELQNTVYTPTPIKYMYTYSQNGTPIKRLRIQRIHKLRGAWNEKWGNCSE